MKKKLWIVPLCVIILLIVISFFLFRQVGDIRPAVLPPKNTTNGSSSSITPHVSQLIDYLKVPDSFVIGVFSENLPGARDLTMSPGGTTILLSQPSQGKVVALPDIDQNGVVDDIKVVADNLDNPHGITFFNNKLYIVEETKVGVYNWNDFDLSASSKKVLFSLPRGGRHSTRSITFDKNGNMYISLGSTCDTCYEKHPFIAAVIISDESGKEPRLFAKGLRNAPFIINHPENNEVWGTEMGRDFLGDNLPPDEINIIRDGADYGWPICYGNKIHDTTFDKNTYIRDPCEDTIVPSYEIPAHSAPLGLAFVSEAFSSEWRGDLLVSYHGSWNRSTPIGYKIVRLVVNEGKIVGSEDFVTGFLENGQAIGRPVDLEFDQTGALYISDDKSGRVYKIVKK